MNIQEWLIMYVKSQEWWHIYTKSIECSQSIIAKDRELTDKWWAKKWKPSVQIDLTKIPLA